MYIVLLNLKNLQPRSTSSSSVIWAYWYPEEILLILTAHSEFLVCAPYVAEEASTCSYTVEGWMARLFGHISTHTMISATDTMAQSICKWDVAPAPLVLWISSELIEHQELAQRPDLAAQLEIMRFLGETGCSRPPLWVEKLIPMPMRFVVEDWSNRSQRRLVQKSDHLTITWDEREKAAVI